MSVFLPGHGAGHLHAPHPAPLRANTSGDRLAEVAEEAEHLEESCQKQLNGTAKAGDDSYFALFVIEELGLDYLMPATVNNNRGFIIN